MQLTRFDRWLREKFVYETHISTLSPASSLPRGISAVKNAKLASRQYKHLYIANSTKAAELLFAQLKENNQMYTTQVVDKQAWYIPLIAPKGKSVTWWVISTVFFIIAGFYVIHLALLLSENPSIRASIIDAFKMFSGR